ncbi:ABC transporter substrate-binding protein [Pseudochrobactrum saccharolyticum]|uniref:ABC-type Fe3+ transport system substrate-binding protein n=1 Tax=Pseudochrobactrum saccharolyticum TaxID=354352 RepID=A0A7W8AJK8_9HYPH|nr:extracellular solute-binding protein [Pseudochrobactrum saccharolyticum]KAB0538292.1 extracellular solute-binding protein [Pseudochrobactrum saccharolyticum]MBB5091542.1 ABC-type Fe3+ transport system substrate-binding protein [Pseudochrobactrum saccharolyticum]MDP8250553.1 extracellular solute-binding protein [Pseudochrobactrum saccharolyticum]
MLKSIAATMLMSAAMIITASAQNGGKVTVVTSFSKDVTDPFKAGFEANNPGFTLDVQNKSTSSGVKYVDETKSNNQVDLFWASAPDAFEVLKGRNLLSKFTPSVTGLPDKVGSYPVNDPDSYYFGFAASGYGIMSNDRYLEANNLTKPVEWSDLAKPEYYDHVAIAAPSRSGTTHLTIETILQGEGWDQGWTTLKNIGGNLQQVTERSYGVPDAVNSGQTGIGIVIDFFAFSAQASGFPVSFSYPSVTTVVPANIGVVANAPNQAGAEAFVNYLLSEKGQAVLLEPAIRRLPINPASYANAPEGFPNPFKDARFQTMLVFDSETSKNRTDAVDALYDQLISFQLDNLKAATRAIHAAEKALAANEQAPARALVNEARALVAAMPVSADEAVSQQLRDAFSGGKEKTARQAELEQQWAAFAKEKYSAAKAKAEEALALVN